MEHYIKETIDKHSLHQLENEMFIYESCQATADRKAIEKFRLRLKEIIGSK